MRDLLLPGDDGEARGRNTSVPARVRAGRDLPVRPALRLQRVLQVLQEPREQRLQVHPGRPPDLLRRGVSHVTGIITSAGRSSRRCRPVRRRVAARTIPRRRAVDGPVHPQGQGGDARRAHRRSRDHADPPRRLPGAELHEPALATVGPRSPAGRRAGLPRRRRSDRLAVLPVDLPGPRVRVFSRDSWRPHPGGGGDRSTATRGTCTSSGCGSTCARR